MKTITNKSIKHCFNTICDYLEIVMSIALVVVIIALGVRMLADNFSILTSAPLEAIDEYIGNIMTLAVGVELVKMLSQHSPSTVIEVLVFAIARQMIVHHGDSWETLVNVIALAVLFAIEKFLVTPHTGHQHEMPEEETADSH